MATINPNPNNPDYNFYTSSQTFTFTTPPSHSHSVYNIPSCPPEAQEKIDLDAFMKRIKELIDDFEIEQLFKKSETTIEMKVEIIKDSLRKYLRVLESIDIDEMGDVTYFLRETLDSLEKIDVQTEL